VELLADAMSTATRERFHYYVESAKVEAEDLVDRYWSSIVVVARAIERGETVTAERIDALIAITHPA